MDGEVTGTRNEKTQLALDTDKGTAVAMVLASVFLTAGLIWQIRHLLIGRMREVQYKPFNPKVDLTSVSALLGTIAPLVLVWLVWSYWRVADKLERATAVLYMFTIAAGVVLRNVEVSYTVRYSLSVCTHIVGLVVSAMIIAIIVKWFRSIVRYV